MRRLPTLLLLGLLCLGSASCAKRMQQDFLADPAAPFEAYQSFSLMPVDAPGQPAPTVAPELLEEVRQLAFVELRSRGFTPVLPDKADLLIAVSIQGLPQVGAPIDETAVESGTVTIALVDRMKNNVIWKGTGRKGNEALYYPDVTRDVIHHTMAQYPPEMKE